MGAAPGAATVRVRDGRVELQLSRRDPVVAMSSEVARNLAATLLLVAEMAEGGDTGEVRGSSEAGPRGLARNTKAMADQKRSWPPLAGNPRLRAQAEANLDALAAAVQAQPGLTVAEYEDRLRGKVTWKRPAAAIYQHVNAGLGALGRHGLVCRDGRLWGVGA